MKQTGFYTRKQAAEKLGVQPDTLAHWAWLGIGPLFIKRNGRCIYTESSIVAYLRSLPVGGGVSVSDGPAALSVEV